MVKVFKKLELTVTEIDKILKDIESQTTRVAIAEMWKFLNLDNQLEKLKKPAKKRYVYKQLGLDGYKDVKRYKFFESISEEKF